MPNYSNNNRGYQRRNTSYAAGNPSPSLASHCPDECYRKNDILDGLAVAMAYVPWQEWECPYDYQKGYHRGTIFPSLDKPFCGRGGANR